MDVFDKIGEFFNGATSIVDTTIRNLFGSANERQVKGIGFVRSRDGKTTILPGSILDRINQLEPVLEKLSNDELKQTAIKLRAKLATGSTLDDILPEAFAAVRESGKRFLRMRHYDVQMVGGVVLHQGKISEMMTGEGKTLVATLPTFLNALAGHVHVVTVNDYLAKRDMEWMGPIHLGLGLTVGAIQSHMQPHERQREYAADITYGTNNEFGFDYLRDNMKPRKDLQVQGPLDYAIVDEVDNILIDEARTPLIISGPADDDITKYPKADGIARQLIKGEDFEVKEKEHSCHLTDAGVRHAEQLVGVDSFYTAGNMEWPHLLDNALKAHHLYKRDVNYVVEQGEIVIVDEHTGRKMQGRQWSDGLHQAVEAKEGVRVKEVSQTLATITLQNYFKLYKKLGGMTGTAMTEAGEFYKIYGLDVVAIPTNKPSKRVNVPDVIYRSEGEKWNAVVQEIADVHKTGRPMLVGTVSIEKSEHLSKLLSRVGVKHNVLNAKYHEREAEIVAQAGRWGAVTIATNMAGRGTDIILGGNPEHAAWEQLKQRYVSRLEVPKQEWDDVAKVISDREGMKEEGKRVSEAGGLHVVGTERHDARRIDLQLRGRAGRQGDPGSSRFFLSLEDDLMRIFAGDTVKNLLGMLGMQEGEAIESGMVTRQIEKAQKRVEERHFESRKNLLEYDEVMDFQRRSVYTYRQRVLDGASCRELILEMIGRLVKDIGTRPPVPRILTLIESARADRLRHFLDSWYRWDLITAWSVLTLGIQIEPNQIKGMEKEQLVDFLTTEMERQWEGRIVEQMVETLPEDSDERDWNWISLAKWANQNFGSNLQDRDLKKVAKPEGLDEWDRSALEIFLNNKAKEAIAKTDFSILDAFLAEDFQQNQLCGWLRQQFTLNVNADEFTSLETNAAIALVMKKVRERYQEQEAWFPVICGVAKFSGNGKGATDREGLVAWANSRFDAELKPDDVADKSLQKIVDELVVHAKSHLPPEDVISKIDGYLKSAYNGTPQRPADPQALKELVDYANGDFEAALPLSEVERSSKDVVRNRLLQSFDRYYRPELGSAERAILLDVLDTAWKEHLYYMDYLRSGIGLVGYAQKDPKVEYKREGMKAFDGMWDRVAEQVTSAIFRIERESSADYLSHVWHETSADHQEVRRAADEFRETAQSQQVASHGAPEPGGDSAPIAPIRNRVEKVGRNDPCPCGSGKKYKKCHGA
jgi:preprotein translocase subunit SecA